MDPYIRIALDRAALVREIYRRVANVQHPDTWHPLGLICPTCGKVGTTIVTDWDGEQVFFECRADLVTWAHGCGYVGLDQPVRRRREAAVEPRVGRPVVALRRDHRAVRQGPGDGRRLARPERRDRARGVRARAAAQRPVRVPEHRRQEDVDLEGPGRRRAHDRRGRPAGAAPLPVPPPAAEPGHRVRSGRHRRRSRACSTSSTGSRRRPPAARSRASCRRATRRRSATPCSTRTRTSPPRPPRSGLPSRTSRCSSRSRAWTSPRAVEAEKGRPADRARGAILDERDRRGARWLETYAPERARLARPARRPARGGRAPSTRSSGASSPRSPSVGERRGTRAAATPGRRAIFNIATERRPPAAARLRGASTSRSSGGRTGRAPAGCWRASIRRSSSRGCARPAGATLTGGGGMSVGLQRLREEPDAIRKGAIDKGEDPALVDRALELDAERRRLLGESEALKAERNAASKQIGEAIKGGATPDGPEVADLKRGLDRSRRADHGARRRARRRSRRSSRTCSCASPTRPTRTSRSVARRPTSPSASGASSWPTTSRSRARSARMRRPAVRPGRASPTGSSPRRSTSSTTRAARRSPARASRSTRARARRSSGRSSTGSSTSTPARTA